MLMMPSITVGTSSVLSAEPTRTYEVAARSPAVARLEQDAVTLENTRLGGCAPGSRKPTIELRKCTESSVVPGSGSRAQSFRCPKGRRRMGRSTAFEWSALNL